MTTTTTTTPSAPRLALPGKFHDAQEWLHALGDVPLSRVVMDPWPGTATEQDLLLFVERDKRLVELIDGTLVEKPVGLYESLLAAYLITALNNFVLPRKLGFVMGEAGMMRLFSGRVRIPDVSFISIGRFPAGPVREEPMPSISPDLAVEVLSESNTKREMDQKLKEYFQSGTRLAWIIDPATRTVSVYTEASESPALLLTESDTLDGGGVLPGFLLSVNKLFNVLP